jgi:hypothetical protein
MRGFVCVILMFLIHSSLIPIFHHSGFVDLFNYHLDLVGNRTQAAFRSGELHFEIIDVTLHNPGYSAKEPTFLNRLRPKGVESGEIDGTAVAWSFVHGINPVVYSRPGDRRLSIRNTANASCQVNISFLPCSP